MKLLNRLLRFPTFYKILLANSVIVTTSVVGFYVGMFHAQRGADAYHWDFVATFALVGVFLSFAVNFLVLKAALLPVTRLQEAARRVRAGDLGARVDKISLSDTSLDELLDAFNAMLESIELHQTQLQKLSGEILQAQEEERKRVARELHDETAQALTALLVRLRLLSKASTLEEAQSKVAELRELTARALEDVRRLALELRCAVLDDLGLVAALESYIDEYNGRYDIQARLECSGFPRRLPPQAELALYRVAQESLTNVARHSSAKHVLVRLQVLEDGWAYLSVEDDGVGFDVSEVLNRRNGGLGIFGMKERVALLRGELWIDSVRGKRTMIRACIPVTQQVARSA